MVDMPLFSPTRRMLSSRPNSVFVQSQKPLDTGTVTITTTDSVTSREGDEVSSASSMSGSQEGECCSRPHTPSSSQPDLVHSPTCLYSKRPTLGEILSDKASPPWTLSAFTAYCSQNLCLENLEFTIDTCRYEKSYMNLMTSGRPTTPSEMQQLSEKWRRLLQIYIAPSAPREINIPGNVRDGILRVSEDDQPPSPKHLQPAVRKIRELLEDSILLPFLNEVKSLEPMDDYSTPYAVDVHHRSNTLASPGIQRDPQFGYLPRKQTSMPGSRPQRPTTYLPALNSRSSGSGSGRSEMAMTSDASDVSPSRYYSPATPPHSPPNITFADRMASPRARSEAGGGGGGGGGWKKMSEKLGLRKSSHSKLKTSKSGSGGGGSGSSNRQSPI